MKNILTFAVLISFTIFTACNNQEMQDDLISTHQESASFNTDNTDNSVEHADGVASFTIENEDKLVYERDALLLTNNSVNAVSYRWDFGNGHTSTEAHPSYEYEIHGNYTITLTVIDANNKIHRTSNDILVLCVFGGGNHNQ